MIVIKPNKLIKLLIGLKPNEANNKNSIRILDPTSKYKDIQVFNVQVFKYLSIQVSKLIIWQF